ncbi:MAG: hypothetical protein ABIO88_08660 [Burkholderiaceae bacterium]
MAWLGKLKSMQDILAILSITSKASFSPLSALLWVLKHSALFA